MVWVGTQLLMRHWVARLSFLWKRAIIRGQAPWSGSGILPPKLVNVRGLLPDESCQDLPGLGLPGTVSQLPLRQCLAGLSFLWKRDDIHSHAPGAKSGILPPKIVNILGI